MAPKPGIAVIVPKDTIAYHLHSKFVYVKPAGTYEQAIEVAQQEFPDELGDIPCDRISLSLHTKLDSGVHDVRISESAWPAIVGSPHRSPSGLKVIDIHVKPLPPRRQSTPDSDHTPSPPRSKRLRRSPSPYPFLDTTSTSQSWFSKLFSSTRSPELKASARSRPRL
ncbi:hypothetical protein LshimejAT787_0703850 [Lyophyllum shimeji]|uniref:Uncharacterized protein n=1 Tax=Lyophyllum shimeji TaxID=47721 RepID=A0A9P3PPW7_LYOSH|nr:hypothetical protein LshimejAT787_0703850 [Lyophyllum shimeji]